MPQDLSTVITVFVAACSVLSVVIGWLLNRVFKELDGLRRADQDLADKLAKLAPLMIDRSAFDKHVDREEIAFANQRADFQTAIAQMKSEVRAAHAEMTAGLRTLVEAQTATRIQLSRMRMHVGSRAADQEDALGGD